MSPFLKALPITATSPTAYAAYVLTLLAWGIIAWRVKRHKILLTHLESLPPEDRLSAIKAEMGVIEIKGGVSADQWLRSRIHTFYLVGFLVLCATLFTIGALAMFQHAGSVSGTIGLER